MSAALYLNHYHCDHCHLEWEDEWSCMCDDRCPNCNASMSPYHSDEMIPEPEPQSLYERLGKMKLAVVDVSDFMVEPFYGWYVNRLLVPEGFRNQGVGTLLMERLCARVDGLNITLYIHPSAGYGSDLDRLTRFYERFGFRTYSYDGLMRRLPHSGGDK